MSVTNDEAESAHRRLMKRRYRELGLPPLAYVWPISDDVRAFETVDGRSGWINFETLEYGWAPQVTPSR